MPTIKSKDHSLKRVEVANTKLISNGECTLFDYDSGSVIFLNVTGNTDVPIVLPQPRLGLNFRMINAVSPTLRSASSGTGDAVITTASQSSSLDTTALNDKICVQGPPEYYTAGLAEIYTLTFSSGLIDGNKFNCSINGVNVSTSQYSTSSDITMQLIATSIGQSPAVNNATVTVLGGNQTGSDDRVITIEGMFPGEELTIANPVIAGGSSQANIELVKIRDLKASVNGGARVNLQADRIKVKSTSLGGEFLDFICDGTFWYCNISRMDGRDAIGNSNILVEG